MSFKLVAAATFKRDVKRLTKRYRSLPADLLQLADQLTTNPQLGVPLGRDCFKIRMAISSKGGGKSSGARVLTYVRVVAEEITLLAVIDKSEEASISEARRDELLHLLRQEDES